MAATIRRQSTVHVDYFAFFDDNLHRPDNPLYRFYTSKRFKILGFLAKGTTQVSSDTITKYEVFRPSVTMGEQHRGMELRIRKGMAQPLAPKRMYLQQENGVTCMATLWRTRISLWYEAQQKWIPVLGAIEPSAIMGNFLYSAELDTKDECYARQVLQISERIRILDTTAGPTPLQPPPPVVRAQDDDADLRLAIQRSLEDLSSMVQASTREVAAAGGGGRTTPSASAPGSTAPPTMLPPVTRVPVAPLPPAAPTFVPKHVLNLVKQDALRKEDSCPISMTPFTDCSSMTVTSCFHVFDTESINTWLTSHTTCPVCKQAVTARAVV